MSFLRTNFSFLMLFRIITCNILLCHVMTFMIFMVMVGHGVCGLVSEWL